MTVARTDSRRHAQAGGNSCVMARGVSAPSAGPCLLHALVVTPGTASSAPARTARPASSSSSQRNVVERRARPAPPAGCARRARGSAATTAPSSPACRASRAGFSAYLASRRSSALEIARQVRELRPRRGRGRSPGGRARRAARRDSAPSRASAGGSALSPLRQRLVLGGDRREQPERALGHRRQPRARALHLLGERRAPTAAADRRRRRRDRRRRRATSASSRSVGIAVLAAAARPARSPRRRPSSKRASGVLERDPDQAHDAGARRRRRRGVARVEQRERDAVAVVDERRVAGDPLAAACTRRQRLGQVAEVPDLRPRLFERRARLRERQLRRLAELRAQRGEVAAGRRARVPAASTTRTLQPQMRAAARRASQASAGGASPSRAAQVRAQRIGQGQRPAERRRLEERGHRVGQRHQPVAQRLGQRLESTSVTFSRIIPGTSHDEPRRVELVEERERHRQREAVERMARARTGT